MRTHKIACQMITFGNFSDKSKLMETLKQVKNCGYDGIECGYEILDLLEKGDLESVGLELCATHTAFDFKNPNFDPEAVMAHGREIMAKSSAMGSRLSFISALYYQGKTRLDFEEEARFFTRYGQMTKEYGIDFCFHNHHWEFKNNMLGFSTYFATWDSRYVHLLPDVGWITRSEVDPVEFLTEHDEQVKAIHFKEFTFDDRFTELGHGVVDFPAVYEHIKNKPIWIIAEQDTCQGAPIESVAENARYLIDLMDGKIAPRPAMPKPVRVKPEHKVACAMIVYGDVSTKERALHAVRDMKDAGYDGFECGLDTLALIEKSELEDIGIELLAAHIGLDFRTLKDPIAHIETMRPIIKRAQELGAQYLFVSAVTWFEQGREEYLREADALNHLGRIGKEFGLPLCYHNHNWEFKRDMAVFNAYFERLDTELVHLVPDVGWVMRGGADPVTFLAEHRGQVKAVHFKEFTFDDHFAQLGKGIVDFRRIYDYIRPFNGMWIVLEQDACDGAPEDAVRENLRYVRTIME